MAERKRLKVWMCVEKCQWGQALNAVKIYQVGETVAAFEQPCRHFIGIESNKVTDPITVLREALDDHGIAWDRNWSLDRLQRELAIAKEMLQETSAQEK